MIHPPHRRIGPERPTIADPTGRLIQIDSAVIVSVLPVEFREDLRAARKAPSVSDFTESHEPGLTPENAWLVRRCTNAFLPAAPVGGGSDAWSALTVYGGLALREQIDFAEGKHQMTGVPFTAREEASRLLTEWGKFPEERLHGVGLRVFGSVSEVTPAAILELQRQTAASLHVVLNNADTLWRIPNGAGQARINQTHVLAAEILNVNRPWAVKREQVKACPGCGSSLGVSAVICSACSSDLRELWLQEIANGYRTLEELRERDSLIYAQLERSGRLPASETETPQPATPRATRAPRAKQQAPTPVPVPAPAPPADTGTQAPAGSPAAVLADWTAGLPPLPDVLK